MPTPSLSQRVGRSPRVPRVATSGAPYNAPDFLNTPTPDGTGKGTHVDVVWVEAGLFGYKYWMAFTPFAASNDLLENPTILVSQDGLAWSVHPNMVSTSGEIDPTPTSGFNSDPDLLLGQDGVLYCYYRSSGETGNSGIKVRSSSNGFTWSAETLLPFAVDLLSPTVIWDGSTYVMYGVQLGVASDGSQDTVIRSVSSSPLGPWPAVTTCTYTIPAGPRGPWHLDATRLAAKTVLLVNEKRSGRTLGFASSTDGATFTVGTSPFMSPTINGWNSIQLYRGCAEPHPNGVDLRVWYSAQGSADWRVGYTTVPRSLIP